MLINKLKNNRGFVLLFAVTLSAILLAIALGVANIALKQVNFSTSARNTNDAFFAADTGAECALFNDKSTSTTFTQSGGTIQCLGTSITLNGNSPTWNFIITGLGSGNQSCAKVSVDKSAAPQTTVISQGYNDGGSTGCVSSSTSRVERELQVTYGGTGGDSIPIWTLCADENGTCSFSGTTQVRYGDDAHGLYNYLDATNSIACNNATFGDSDPGTFKHCDYNSAAPGGVDGTGGNLPPVHIGGYTIHTFTSGGTFTPPSGVSSVQVLVVAGGGGGGFVAGGGGGAGGLIYETAHTVTARRAYTVTVGAGGDGGTTGNVTNAQGKNGANSVFDGQTAIGGGGGGEANYVGTAGNSGGSGGGGFTHGAGTGGQGNNAGDAQSPWTSPYNNGGGGGVGEVGTSGGASQVGNGGAGTANSISGASVPYAGGGGGGSTGTAGTGTGGGGNGGNGTIQATAGTANTGGGGGGGGVGSPSNGAAGGSGIVIIRYLTP